MKKYFCLASLVFLCILACSGDNEETPSNPDSEAAANILLIIADDLGLDALNGYSEGSIKANTPNLDQLMTNGLTFNNFWTNPVCSPTRASILTGKYGYSTGVLSPGDEISTGETSLQSYISQQTNDEYTTAIVGKWHLSGENSAFNPEDMGIDYYAGLLSGGVGSYYNWDLTEDGSATRQTEYATTKFTDLAIDWVAEQTKPWFLWLAYNAPHTPFHAPPQEMHSQGALATDQASIDANPTPYYMASIEAMDYQIGRLLASLGTAERENTVIIFMGDNGSPNQVSQSPYGRRRAKGTVYQGGVNCPLIISGFGVNRIGNDNALLNSTDLFATIASLAGVSVISQNDSQNFTQLLTSQNHSFRDFAYAEVSGDTRNEWAIRNDAYKLIVDEDGNEQLYNLTTDPYEDANLLLATLSVEAQAAKTLLETKLGEVRQ